MWRPRRGAGIYVSNCPGKNSVAVAELAFALILALDRRIADNVVGPAAGAIGTRAEFSKAPRVVRPHAGPDRRGPDRSRDDPARQGLRHAGGGLEPQPDSGGRQRTGHRVQGVARSKSAQAADIVSVHVAANAQTQGPDRRELLRRDAAGRVFHQHLARGGGGSGGLELGRRAAMACARAWTCSPTSRPAARANSPMRS